MSSTSTVVIKSPFITIDPGAPDMFSTVGDSPACSKRLVFFYDYDFKTGVEIVEISPHLVDPVT